MPPRRRGDRRRGHLRLGLAVARRVEGAGPGFCGAGQQARDLGAVDDPRVELVVAGMIEPAGEAREVVLVLGEIHDAAGAKPGLGLDPLVHPLPQPQALDDQRDFAGVARHLAAPAPVAARLLAGDVALLAQHGRDAPLGEEQRGAGADDAAADDHDIGAGPAGSRRLRPDRRAAPSPHLRSCRLRAAHSSRDRFP